LALLRDVWELEIGSQAATDLYQKLKADPNLLFTLMPRGG
jgi:hypothetical protein